MPDYGTHAFILKNRGVMARYVDDMPPSPDWYLSTSNLEDIEESGLGSRLGSVVINKTGVTINPLPGVIHSLAYLGGLSGQAWRYVGCGTNLYRRNAAGFGPYTLIKSGLSGQPWTAVSASAPTSSMPALFIADANMMLKDYGTGTPEQMGIFQPQYPVQAQAQAPTLITLDNYTGSSGDYTYTGVGGGTIGAYVATTLTSAVAAPGIATVSVAAPMQVGLFQLLTIDAGGAQEVVLVIGLTPTGFTAQFANAHASGATVASQQLGVTVPASTTATVSKSFGGLPIAAWPVTLDQEDYIGLYLFVSDPAQIQKITLKFDCGDGSFNSDYFYKIIGQGPLQTLLDENTDSSTGAADAVLSETLGLYEPDAAGITQLNTGLSQWSPLLIQLSDFAGAGRADFNDQVFNWSNVNGYQVEIITNDNSSATVEFAALMLFGGAGPDSFAGVSYDWLFTFYNILDGTESNPCMVMSSVNPPFSTNWITPRRQPVLLTMTHPALDPQTTYLRAYRRGGTLGDNWRRLDQVPCSGATTQYLDIKSDAQIQQADTISFTNDVPVTSGLPNPVNTVLTAPVTTTNQVATVFPLSMANISVAQQVTLGDVTLPNSEIVIVLTISPGSFTAFVQNTHANGETVSATASYGTPVTIIAYAFDQGYFAGDKQNPSFLYYSAKSNVQAVSSAGFVFVGKPDDPLTVIADTKGNLFVSSNVRWWAIAPGSQPGAAPIVYPTASDFGCVAPLGACVKGKQIYYQAIDGIRIFNGGDSGYLTQILEFVFQGIGTTPIPMADPTQLALTRMTFWHNMVFCSYIGKDGQRHRLIFHTEYQRWRDDLVDSQSLLLEAETSSLIYGDSNGMVHVDRQDLPYDEGAVAQGGQLVLAQNPIPFKLITPYTDGGLPTAQKQYNEFTLDANTNGQDVTVTLLFNDGQFSLVLGVVNTAVRQRVNLSLNAGDGVEAYKVAMQLTGQSLTGRVLLYQSKIRTIALAETRQSLDTYWIDGGTSESKFAKQIYFDYNSTTPITCIVYYDSTSTFEFTLASTDGKRLSFRQRLPGIKFRLIRLVMDTTADFQLWNTTFWELKPVGQGKGYEHIPVVP